MINIDYESLPNYLEINKWEDMFYIYTYIVLFAPMCSYVVTLVTDGVRSVRGFNFDKAAASVLTSCVCNKLTMIIKLSL